MDKSWLNQPRFTTAYKDGVRDFLQFAMRNAFSNGKIMCPCIRCVNCSQQTLEIVREHLICDGFMRGYTTWILHGEELPSNMGDTSCPLDISHRNEIEHVLSPHTLNPPRLRDNMVELLQDALRDNLPSINDTLMDANVIETSLGDGIEEPQNNPIGNEQLDETSNRETSDIHKFLKEVDAELYPGCKNFSKLSFLIHLYHLKCLNGWTGKSFGMLLELLIDAFPDGTTLPKSVYESKKIIQALGLNYEKIHSCEHDCMLFWGENKDEESCKVCGSSRWKINKGNNESNKTNKKPVKVLRYFPLIPRLQRIYASAETAKEMRWHEDGRNKDGLLRHPADGEAWKAFDARYPDFSSEPRNVRLGLCSDGFSPFGIMSTSHSTWPVVLIPYNTPPWICMKQSSFILSMIIPGKNSPGNDIDIYLQPLISELKELWSGVSTFDSFKKERFSLRAALMWTLNDLPALAMLSGWSTKGKFACPCCASSTSSIWLNNSKKQCYMGHRRWLPEDHIFRKQAEFFDATEELRVAPIRANGSDVLNQLDRIQHTYGKQSKMKKRKKRSNEGNDDSLIGWKKRSIFFELPYWQHNLLRHNLDVMHIEKNVCDNFLDTFLNVAGKSKDNLNARLDLEELGIRSELHAQNCPNGKHRLPPASFTLTKREKNILCGVLQNVKMPDGYASNISRCVRMNENKVVNLKSHDCHILIQYLLPVALKSCSPSKEVISIVIEVASFFRSICSKVIDSKNLDKIQNQIILTLCKMEKTFLPSFFTIMPHLMIHLVEEARMGGPVQYRWMYPLERYLHTLCLYFIFINFFLNVCTIIIFHLIIGHL